MKSNILLALVVSTLFTSCHYEKESELDSIVQKEKVTEFLKKDSEAIKFVLASKYNVHKGAVDMIIDCYLISYDPVEYLVIHPNVDDSAKKRIEKNIIEPQIRMDEVISIASKNSMLTTSVTASILYDYIVWKNK
jgi:hypothetical protein